MHPFSAEIHGLGCLQLHPEDNSPQTTMSSMWQGRAVLSWEGVCRQGRVLWEGPCPALAPAFWGASPQSWLHFSCAALLELLALFALPVHPGIPIPSSLWSTGSADFSETLVDFAQRGTGSKNRPADVDQPELRLNTTKISILLALPSTSEASPPPLSPARVSLEPHK